MPCLLEKNLGLSLKAVLFEDFPGDFPRHLAPAAPAATLRADDVESNDQGGETKNISGSGAKIR